MIPQSTRAFRLASSYPANILGAKRVLEEAAKQGVEPKVALRTFFKDVRNIIG